MRKREAASLEAASRLCSLVASDHDQGTEKSLLFDMWPTSEKVPLAEE